MTNYQHTITKSDLRQTNWIKGAETALAPGHVRLRVNAFALTANNVTYAVFGGAPMFYWNFFPSSDVSNGRVPVWGFATVEESNSKGIFPGQRVYGYLPIAETFDVLAAGLSSTGFSDAASHRSELAPIYNSYVFTDADPSYDGALEDQQMLFRPLYLTGWMICDCLIEGEQKPDEVVISSASSKTALATAHALKARGVRTIGLTSSGNKTFVEKSGLFDKTHLYEEVPLIKVSGNTAYVDFAGRPALTMAVHQACGENLKRSMVIGMTDWESDRATSSDLPGPPPEFFFVPTYAAARAKELPRGELDRRVMTDLVAFYPISKNFVTPEHIKGKEAISQAWLDTVEGKISPTHGLICSF